MSLKAYIHNKILVRAMMIIFVGLLIGSTSDIGHPISFKLNERVIEYKQQELINKVKINNSENKND
jgi:hypothetical protein